ncbi:MAG TPA: hypothetical protein VNL91_07320 [Thermoanaerobaculia bacterium]|nr:hypothetical protein [Thermoanaerobaculia bacterium]
MSAIDPATAPRGTRAKTTAVLVVIVTFVAGALVGVAADRFYLASRRDRFPSYFARAMTPRIVKHLDRRLDLTPDQRRQVEEVLERHRGRIDAISRATRPQIRREIEAANAEIEKILTPEQRERFAKMKMRIHQRRARPR